MSFSRIIERTVSLDAMALRESLPGLAYQGEQSAHQFVIHCTQHGAAVTLTGSVLLKFLRPDGIAVDVPGSVVDGAAVVTLSGNCYEVMGRAEITIFVTEDGASVAVYSANTAVTRTTSGEEISGGDIINLTALQERFEDMADAIEDCETATSAAEAVSSKTETLQDELIGVESRVLNEVQLPNDFIPGRFMEGGFANVADYARNRNAYPPGRYAVGPYRANSFLIAAYISDTQGEYLINQWAVTEQIITSTRPFYVTFNGVTDSDKLAAINSGMIVKRLATAETIETRVPASPEMYGAKGDGTTDDTVALTSMFASGHGDYLLTQTYAVSAAVDFSGYIHGGGTVKAHNLSRIAALFNLDGDAVVDGITFDCNCSTDFVESDYGNTYNVAISAESVSHDLVVKNCEFINGYTAFIKLHIYSGNLSVERNKFVADGTNNQWTGYMLHMLSITGTEPICIRDNIFIGNGTAASNFSGIFMSGISTRKIIDIGGNLFDGVGRDKTGHHQSHCIDCYFDVSNLYAHDNVMQNNPYCCLRIHGGTNFVIQNNVFGEASAQVSDSCILISDDIASTGATQIGVSDVRILNNMFKSSIRFTSAIQLTSTSSNGAGLINGVTISGNTIDGNYPYAIIFDGSVSNMAIERNLIISPANAIQLRHDGVLFQGDRPVSITDNALTSAGGSAISSSGALGNPKLAIARNSLDGYMGGVILDQDYQNTSAMDNIITITRPGESYGTKGVSKVARNLIEMVIAASAISGAATAYGNYVNGELIQ